MNISTIAQPNTKGQIVIPKKIREQLGITPDTSLHISVQGYNVVLSPVTHASSRDLEAESEIRRQVLKQTQGAWGPETASEKKHRLLIERKNRADSKRMKQIW